MQYERALGSTQEFGGAAAIDAPAPGVESGAPVRQILAVIRKRKWLLASSVLGGLIIGLVVTLLMTPQYTARTTIEIQREEQNFTNVRGADASRVGMVDPEFLQTQVGLLRARSLATRVVTEMHIADDPKFFDTFKVRAATGWFENGRPKPGASTRETRVNVATSVLLSHLDVSLERLSRLVTISFTSPDPALSQRVADAWGAQFIQATLERRYVATSYARKFLEDRLGQLRVRINQAEQDLVSYASQEGIVVLSSEEGSSDSGGSNSATQSLIGADLAAMNRELALATAARIEAQSRLGARGNDVVEAISNGSSGQLRARRAEVAGQYAEMLQRFAPNYPPAVALKSQIDTLDRAIAAEEGRTRATLQRTYQASLAREKELAGKVEQLKTQLFDLRRRSTKYNILLREVDTNRQLYDALLQRYKEIGIAGGVGVNNISVIDSAQMPAIPSSPRLMWNLVLALFGGMLVGAALAFLLEQLEESISDPAEVAQLLGIPLLGVVPKVDDDPVGSLADPKSALSEAYFSVQTSLALTTAQGFPRTLVITSSRPSEGKSLTAFGVAKTLAVSGRRVVLIDADMRSPSVHHVVGVRAAPGLSNLLAGAMSVSSALQETSVANLMAIAAGPQPPSAAELLSGNRLAALLAELAEHFDHVIVDAPPVMGFADAPLVASQVEGVAFVIEAHGTGKSTARAAIARLRGTGSDMFGAIVSKFDVKRAHYGYGYNYGYGYGYGEAARDPSDAGR